MKKSILSILISLLSVSFQAQNLNFDWAKSMGSPYNDFGHSIIADASGNVFVTGSFSDTVDFDPGPSTFNLISNGLEDVFVQKLDASGNFIWAVSMGGTKKDVGQSINIDASGNVFVTGMFQNTVDFDPGAVVLNLTSAGDNDIFIQKLNANGNLIWALSIGSSGPDEGNSIITDASGNVHVTGSFSGTVDFDPRSSTSNLVSNGFEDIFILKLNGNGVFKWAKSLGGNVDDQGNSISVDDSGNVCVTGYFSNSVDFDPSTSTFTLMSNGQGDIFVLKLDANGDFIWARSIGASDNDIGQSLSIDYEGYVYTTGNFSGTADFDPSSSTFNLTSSGSSDVFIVKLGPGGNLIWAKSIGGTQSESSNGIYVDVSRRVYVTGNFFGTADFNPGSASFNLTVNGNVDGFILILDVSGNFVWAHNIGSGVADGLCAAATDNLGNVYLVGAYQHTVDFDPGAATFEMTANDWSDIFILKLSMPFFGLSKNDDSKITSLYPNPTTGELNIDLKKTYKNVTMTLSNINGSVVHNEKLKEANFISRQFNYPKGLYILKLHSEDQYLGTSRIIIE